MHTSRRQNKSIIPVIQRRSFKHDGLSPSELCKLRNSFLPNNPCIVKDYKARVSCGVYSKDGKYFIAATHGKLNYLSHAISCLRSLMYIVHVCCNV